jgi:hypothetical protein
MGVPSSMTVNFDAVLSTTLMNYKKTLEDNISKNNVVLWHLKKEPGGYELVEDIGERAVFPLMYEIGSADSYSSYDALDVTPTDGMTAAYYEWRQASVPIAISALEEKKNKSESRIINLLEAKTKQAEMGLTEFFNKRFLIGAGGTSITTAYTSPMNGAAFVDPLPLLVSVDGTGTVGNIAAGTYTWWKNQFTQSASTAWATFLQELRTLRMKCARGPGGKPNLHLVDENVYIYYEGVLASKHQNPSYTKADIPFDNIAFYGSPVIPEEQVPDAYGVTATVSAAEGTWYMLNTQFLGCKVEAGTNFAPTPFQKPENQDCKVAHILWLGAMGCSNRRKQGVLGKIVTTTAS